MRRTLALIVAIFVCLAPVVASAQGVTVLPRPFVTGGGVAVGPVLLKDGTAAAPGAAFESDTNTGILRPAADTIGFTFGGTQEWTLSSTYLNASSTAGASGYGFRINGTQVQFKHSGGAWADIVSATSGGGWTDDGTEVRLSTSTDVVSIGSTGGTAKLTITGPTLTGSTATSALSIAQTWNTTGAPTAILANVTNTASGAASLLMDLQVGGVSQFSVSKAGKTYVGGLSANAGGILNVVDSSKNGIELLPAQAAGVNRIMSFNRDTSYQTLAFDAADFSFRISGTEKFALAATTGNATLAGTLTVSGVGPHAIGGAVEAAAQWTLRGTFSPGVNDTAIGMYVFPTLGVFAGRSGNIFYTAGSFTEAASGTHALLAGAHFYPPSITPGAATVTNTAVVYIEAAMSATVSGANYSLWVDNGLARFDGGIAYGTTAGCSGTPSAALGGIVTTCAGPEANPAALLAMIQSLQVEVASLRAQLMGGK